MINEGTESIVSALDGPNTPMYGNFNMGYHWHTPEGVVTDQQFQQAMGIDVVEAGNSLVLKPLIERWAELE